jgi:hypothetical protein
MSTTSCIQRAIGLTAVLLVTNGVTITLTNGNPFAVDYPNAEIR